MLAGLCQPKFGVFVEYHRTLREGFASSFRSENVSKPCKARFAMLKYG